METGWLPPERLPDRTKTSREEAPEEMIFLSRDAAQDALRSVAGKAGRKSDYPKKGRGTSDGFDRELRLKRQAR